MGFVINDYQRQKELRALNLNDKGHIDIYCSDKVIVCKVCLIQQVIHTPTNEKIDLHEELTRTQIEAFKAVHKDCKKKYL